MSTHSDNQLINTTYTTDSLINNKFISDFFITYDYLLSGTDQLYCAVSGGPDSMLLCFLIQKLFPQRNIIILHFDHGFREEGRKDIALIKSYFPTLLIITEKSHSPGKNETDFRKQRLAFFKKNTKPGSIIFTGHTLSDRIETTLLNASRGTNFSGLYSIKEYSEVRGRIFLRPLLGFVKEDIHGFCKNITIPFIVDQSNFDSGFTPRNAIRAKIANYYRCKNQYLELYNIFDTLIEKFRYNNIFEYKTPRNRPLYNAKVLTLFDTQLLFHVLGISGLSKASLHFFYTFFTVKKNGYVGHNGRHFFVQSGFVYVLFGKKGFREKQTFTIDELTDFFGVGSDDSNDAFLFSPGVRCKGSTTKVKKLFIEYNIPVFYRTLLPIFGSKKVYKGFLNEISTSGRFR